MYKPTILPCCRDHISIRWCVNSTLTKHHSPILSNWPTRHWAGECPVDFVLEISNENCIWLVETRKRLRTLRSEAGPLHVGWLDRPLVSQNLGQARIEFKGLPLSRSKASITPRLFRLIKQRRNPIKERLVEAGAESGGHRPVNVNLTLFLNNRLVQNYTNKPNQLNKLITKFVCVWGCVGGGVTWCFTPSTSAVISGGEDPKNIHCCTTAETKDH